MQNALLMGALFVTLALSGCSVPGVGSDKPTGFGVDEPSAAGGTYVFTASDNADNYTWDMGDHLTTLYGKKVEHAYDFENGNVTVTLIQKKGDERKDFQKRLQIGNGQNQPSVFYLEAEQNWTVPGEQIRLSGRLSTDPDNDNLRYSWNCIRTGDAVRKAAHTHAGLSNYGTPSAGTVTALYALTPLPPADRTETGDFCEALSASRPSTDITVAGAFERTGIYEIYMLASDPVHPSTSGSIKIWVTDPDERPEPVWRHTFSGELQAGSGGAVEGVVGEQSEDVFDLYVDQFTIPLAALRGYANLTWDDPAGSVAVVSFEITKGDNVQLTCNRGLDPGETALNPCNDEAAPNQFQGLITYQARVFLERGAQVPFDLEVTMVLDMDPGKVY